MKNKRFNLKKVLSVCLILICALIPLRASADPHDSPDQIGMVNNQVPYVYVELKDDELQEADISGKFGSEPMELVNLQNIKDLKKATYIVLDNSASMTSTRLSPSGSFKSIKEALCEFIPENTDENNHFYFYTIGASDKASYIGPSTDSESAAALCDKISELDGKEDYTYLKEPLLNLMETINRNRDDYQLIKILLITDSDAECSKQSIDDSEVTDSFRYNRVPLYVYCNSDKENSPSVNFLNTLARSSGGKSVIYDKTKQDDAYQIMDDLYSDMTTGSLASFITTLPADSKDRELVVTLSGYSYNETILVENEANISAPVNAEIEVNDTNTAFVIHFSQEGFNGNLPLNSKVLDINSYTVKKAGSAKTYPISKIEKNNDGTYAVVMKKDIYTGTYDFTFDGITDNSANHNTVAPVQNLEIKAKSNFWKVFPYLMIGLAVLLVLLAFYLILLHLKKKKNVRTIKELFETQVDETVEEKYYINRQMPQDGGKVRLYFQTSGYAQKQAVVNIVSSVIIGRSSICDVTIEDSKLSRQHLAIEYTDGVYMISDLNSANGTYVNGVKVHSRQRLNSGDMITAGLTSIRIEF